MRIDFVRTCNFAGAECALMFCNAHVIKLIFARLLPGHVRDDGVCLVDAFDAVFASY